MPKTTTRPRRRRRKTRAGRRRPSARSASSAREDRPRGLQGRRPPAQVHLRAGQDPGPPGDGELLAAPAGRGHGGQERPRDGAAALHGPMKIILQKAVDKLGAPGRRRRGRRRLCPELPDPPGHGRQGRPRAPSSTPGSLKQAHEKRVQQAVADAMPWRSAGGKAPCGSGAGRRGGRLFGSVTVGDVAEAIDRQTGVHRRPATVHLDEPIRLDGAHEVTVHLHPEVDAASRSRWRWTWPRAPTVPWPGRALARWSWGPALGTSPLSSSAHPGAVTIAPVAVDRVIHVPLPHGSPHAESRGRGVTRNLVDQRRWIPTRFSDGGWRGGGHVRRRGARGGGGAAVVRAPEEVQADPAGPGAAAQPRGGGVGPRRDDAVGEAIADVVETDPARGLLPPAHQPGSSTPSTGLYARGEPVDAITAVEELRRRGILEDVGGWPLRPRPRRAVRPPPAPRPTTPDRRGARAAARLISAAAGHHGDGLLRHRRTPNGWPTRPRARLRGPPRRDEKDQIVTLRELVDQAMRTSSTSRSATGGRGPAHRVPRPRRPPVGAAAREPHRGRGPARRGQVVVRHQPRRNVAVVASAPVAMFSLEMSPVGDRDAPALRRGPGAVGRHPGQGVGRRGLGPHRRGGRGPPRRAALHRRLGNVTIVDIRAKAAGWLPAAPGSG